MTEKKSAYKMTTPEQAPLFMCAGKENAGKVPKVDKDGFITEFVEVGSGGTEYIGVNGVIVNNSNHIISLDPNILVDTQFSGNTKAENLDVSGDVKLGSTGSTIDMCEASSIDLGDNATCGTPTTDYGVAPKKYVDTKVAKATGTNKVYGIDGTGAETTFNINVDNGEYTVAYRGPNSTLKVGTPTEDEHATTKKYVDDKINQVISKTYAEVKALRDAGNLEVGKYYRITDYVATTTKSNTQSANHPFDIIIVAVANNEFSEEATAYWHEGDTYFTNSNLLAWDVWYCLDNDKSRFGWADATNGKGVVYYIKDEFSNSCWYDWKGIQVNNDYKNDRFYYLFDNDGNDASMSNSTSFPRVYANEIGVYVASNKIEIPRNIFYNSTTSFNVSKNKIGDNSFGNSINGTSFYSNNIQNEFVSNSFEVAFSNRYNFIGNNFSSNIIKKSFQRNCIGNTCTNNTFFVTFGESNIENWFVSNTIGTDGSTGEISYCNFGNGIEYVDFTDAGSTGNTKEHITIPSGYAGTSDARKTLSSMENNTTYYLNTAQLS